MKPNMAIIFAVLLVMLFVLNITTTPQTLFNNTVQADNAPLAPVTRSEIDAFIKYVESAKGNTTISYIKDNDGKIVLLEIDYQEKVPVRFAHIIASMHSIQFLTLRGNDLTAEHFDALANSVSLTSMNISGSNIDIEAMRSLVKMENIETLNFYDVTSDSQLVSQLSEMSKLRELTIGHKDGVDYEAILNVCSGRNELKSIDLYRSGITAEEIVSLHRQFPDMYIAWTDKEREE